MYLAVECEDLIIGNRLILEIHQCFRIAQICWYGIADDAVRLLYDGGEMLYPAFWTEHMGYDLRVGLIDDMYICLRHAASAGRASLQQLEA